MSKAKQTVIGVGLAISLVITWALIHVGSIFWLSLDDQTYLLILPIVFLQTWLSAGLFIVAHDAMHGSLAPGSPSLNRWTGSLVLTLYAFFPFRSVAAKHHAHHRHSGSDTDPDFYAPRPEAFWPWYLNFMREYFGFGQFLAISTTVVVYTALLHANVINVLLFWATPSILSSIQLFTFGTWLPHRHVGKEFCDRHNARSLDYGWLKSLAACYHFGYHVEHHRSPQTPWWGLPEVRALTQTTAPLREQRRPI